VQLETLRNEHGYRIWIAIMWFSSGSWELFYTVYRVSALSLCKHYATLRAVAKFLEFVRVLSMLPFFKSF